MESVLIQALYYWILYI